MSLTNWCRYYWASRKMVILDERVKRAAEEAGVTYVFLLVIS